jgi:Na+-transporting NADH:ubiquinone oxidoreductase subunit NqrF
MMDFFSWTKIPMEGRIHRLHEDVGMTVIYGGNSWIKRIPDEEFKQMRASSSFFEIHVIRIHLLQQLNQTNQTLIASTIIIKFQTIPLAGHHVYIDDQPYFNQIVNNVGKLVDEKSMLSKS